MSATAKTASAPSTQAGSWARFAAVLAEQERWLDGYPPAADPVVRATGLRYLGRMVHAALEHELEHSDPRFPHFYRSIDQFANWGGPNTDNQYSRAAISSDHTYLVEGNAANSAGFIFQTITGIWHVDGFEIFDERSSADVEVGDDGRIEIILGGPPQPGNWMPIADRADGLWVRSYGVDWEHDLPCGFTITRIDDDPNVPLSPPPLTPAVIDGRVNRAATWLQTALTYWADHMEGHLDRNGVNDLPIPRTYPGGAEYIRYGICNIDLAEGQALLVELEPPDADYWSLHLYSMPWFENVDPRDAFGSLNHRQLHIDDDGRVRCVIAATDPGTANWLDCSSVPRAQLQYRAVWCRSAGQPTSRVIDVVDARSMMPPGHPLIDATGRRDQLTRRRRAARRWRDGARP